MYNAYNLGYNAHFYGYASKQQCPYMRGSFNAKQWESGWEACTGCVVCANNACKA